MSDEAKWWYLICNCLALYLSVYVTRQLFWHEMPPLRAHVLTWLVILLYVVVYRVFSRRRSNR